MIYFIVKCPDGEFLVKTLSPSATNSKQKAVNSTRYEKWWAMERKGFSVVPVELKEMK